MSKDLKAYVIIATKGRPNDVRLIRHSLCLQSMLPERIIFIGTCNEDLGDERLKKHVDGPKTEYIVSERVGATTQRNVGLQHVLAEHGKDDNFFVIYFDDDFRPHHQWIETAADHFRGGKISALTGVVLADGINSLGISEEDAAKYLRSELPQNLSHWTAKYPDQEIRSTYGCNMAFSAAVCRNLTFDEGLPAYAWQEDRDYSRRASEYGLVWCASGCKGVHLGTKKGRVSGVKFGYSQIANPIYLLKKGSMSFSEVLYLAGRNMLANHAKFFFPESWVDRVGRVKGNWLALFDMVAGRLSPRRIEDL